MELEKTKKVTNLEEIQKEDDKKDPGELESQRNVEMEGMLSMEEAQNISYERAGVVLGVDKGFEEKEICQIEGTMAKGTEGMPSGRAKY